MTWRIFSAIWEPVQHQKTGHNLRCFAVASFTLPNWLQKWRRNHKWNHRAGRINNKCVIDLQYTVLPLDAAQSDFFYIHIICLTWVETWAEMFSVRSRITAVISHHFCFLCRQFAPLLCPFCFLCWRWLCCHWPKFHLEPTGDYYQRGGFLFERPPRALEAEKKCVLSLKCFDMRDFAG